jgi:hypothetical protein
MTLRPVEKFAIAVGVTLAVLTAIFPSPMLEGDLLAVAGLFSLNAARINLSKDHMRAILGSSSQHTHNEPAG